MISQQLKLLANQIGAPTLHSKKTTQKFTLSSRVVSFCRRQALGEIFYRMPTRRMSLFQNSTRSKVGSVRQNTRRKVRIKNTKYRSRDKL